MTETSEETTSILPWVIAQLLKRTGQDVLTAEDRDVPWHVLKEFCEKNPSAASFAGLAFLTEHGLGGIQPDLVKARELRVQAANAGHAESAYKLSRTAASEQEKLTWLRIAASGGNITARYELGKAYEKGRGYEPDQKEAAQYFASCGKYPKALRRLGLIRWEEGETKVAFDLCAEACQQGNTKALLNMAYALEHDSFKPENITTSISIGFLQYAAFAGDARSADALGDRYFFGQEMGGVKYPEDHALAVYWYEHALKLKRIPNSLYRLGECYEKGFFYPKDNATAFRFYQDAAEAGDYLALLAKARLKKTGMPMPGADLPVNLADSLALLNQAILAGAKRTDGGNEAWFQLGNMNMEGEAMPRNVEEALLCWKKAANFEHTGAKKALRDYFLKEASQFV